MSMEVISLTLDVVLLSEHFATVKLLEASINPSNVKLYPITLKNVYVIFDVCHMLKFIRNTFGDKGLFFYCEENKTERRYIKQTVVAFIFFCFLYFM